ncbi:YihY/virulence factor BrkB family protein [Nonomuraea sp. NN258]|uniref:YihY/virulence factor BrkB family protein n=1 Tax=Nonomuraea antri TaxID=2730852 RepID=UPI0015688F17|nr:YihY/virulence factor BrkB family protein [Nonomuraea antri]NRQ32264.1 YihY/virulence factor BrkB family protein [Nonomuraea antri]
MARWAERIESAKSWGRRRVEHWRVRRPFVDHWIRALQRYQVQSGDRLAGAVTYFAFLSFFPLIALSYAVLGFVMANDAAMTKALERAIEERLPGISSTLDIAAIGSDKEVAGLIGLLGLLYAGLGSIDALRGALREISMTSNPPLNFVLGKLRDLAALVLFGVTLISSVAVAGFATTATNAVMNFMFDSTPVVNFVLRVTGIVASVSADWLLFVIMLAWVARIGQPFWVLAKGALLGAVGFGVLKQAATLLLGHTLSNNGLYGTFAVIVGLLIWINFSARLVLLSAAWTATAGFGPPPAPSPIPSNGDSNGHADGHSNGHSTGGSPSSAA